MPKVRKPKVIGSQVIGPSVDRDKVNLLRLILPHLILPGFEEDQNDFWTNLLSKLLEYEEIPDISYGFPNFMRAYQLGNYLGRLGKYGIPK